MPAYHSKQNESKFEEACGCALLPLKTDVRGPADPMPSDQDDIIDETLNYFRANVLFRNFEVRGAADRTMIYLTLFTCQLLVKAEKIEDKNGAIREFKNIATSKFSIPGDSSWGLGGLFSVPQARDELALRLADVLFESTGQKNKWWQAFSKRKFMGKELKD